MLFAGWDWASASHATIIDTAGRMVDRAGLACTEPDLDAALAGWPAGRLAARAAPADLGRRVLHTAWTPAVVRQGAPIPLTGTAVSRTRSRLAALRSCTTSPRPVIAGQ